MTTTHSPVPRWVIPSWVREQLARELMLASGYSALWPGRRAEIDEEIDKQEWAIFETLVTLLSDGWTEEMGTLVAVAEALSCETPVSR